MNNIHHLLTKFISKSLFWLHRRRNNRYRLHKMTYSALFCSVVNKNLCLTPLQYEVSTLTRAQRGEARQGAHTQHHAAFIGSTIVFRVQKYPKKLSFRIFGWSWWRLLALIYTHLRFCNTEIVSLGRFAY